MHVLHFIAVEADTAEEAVREVEIVLENDESPVFPWSDWAVVGGRWEDEGKVHAYSDDPEKFNGFLERARTNRVEELHRLLNSIDVEKAIAIAQNYQGEDIGYNPDLYRLRQALCIADDYGKHDQFFYDLKEWTGHFTYVKERCLHAPDRQFIVLVDFHY
jgi:hypothetical protein